MRDILFLAHRIPYPPNRGDKIRSWNILRHLAARTRVHLGCFADDEADAAHMAALRDALGSALGRAHVEVRRPNRLLALAGALYAGKPLSLALFDSPAMHRFVGECLERERIGTVFAFSGQMAQFVPSDTGRRFVMDFVDMDSAKFADYARAGPLRLIHARESRTLFDVERRVAARADLALFVSEAEAALFREKAGPGIAPVRSMSNGIDLHFYDPGAAFLPLPNLPHPLLVFTGQMDYRPNVEAVTAFADAVLPLVRERHPEACFAIVGRNPAAGVRRLAARPGVVVTGAVEEVRGWLAAADVVVAPLGIARGIQNKVLEAMAMARPVVASPAAFEGIEAEPGRDLLVAGGTEAQAGAILALLADPARAATIGAAARRRMEEGYRWDVRFAPLDAFLAQRVKAAA